ncbi:patatin-like phospholipase family protein [Natronospora cellulosivora (SeqCode)]
MRKILCIFIFFTLITFNISIGAQEGQEDNEQLVLALSLSGGAALGIAHIGVLEVMEEYNIKADIITGTSAGALVGALYAGGMSPLEMEKLASNIKWRDLLGVEIPDMGFFSARGIESFVYKRIEEDNFDNVPIKLAFVATDLNSGYKVIIDGGSISRAVSASAAIPVLYSPVEYKDMLLTDGGLVDNLPIDLARDMGADIIIAVDVLSNFAYSGKPTNQLEVGIRSFNILQQSRVNLDAADILIKPDLEGFRGMDIDRYDELVERGREAARQAFEANQELIEKIAKPKN